MILSDTGISEQQKEVCAILVMRTMLLNYAYDNDMDFEELLLKFCKARTYKLLFDFETGLWREGPDYLCGYFEEDLGVFQSNFSKN